MAACSRAMRPSNSAIGMGSSSHFLRSSQSKGMRGLGIISMASPLPGQGAELAQQLLQLRTIGRLKRAQGLARLAHGPAEQLERGVGHADVALRAHEIAQREDAVEE